DTTQVGMTCKGDAEKIEYFAFVPVRAWPDASHSGHGRMVLAPLAHAYFQTEFAAPGNREEMIDHVIARYPLQPIHRRHARKEIVINALPQKRRINHQLFR